MAVFQHRRTQERIVGTQLKIALVERFGNPSQEIEKVPAGYWELHRGGEAKPFAWYPTAYLLENYEEVPE